MQIEEAKLLVSEAFVTRERQVPVEQKERVEACERGRRRERRARDEVY